MASARTTTRSRADGIRRSGRRREGGTTESRRCPLEDADGRTASEGGAAGQQLVEHDADRIEVGRRGGRSTADHLRREVLGGAGDRVAFLCSLVVVVVALSGETEVDDLDPVGAGACRRDEDVVALHVGVDDAGRVGVLEHRQDLVDDADDPAKRQRSLGRNDGAEGRAAHVLHHQEWSARLAHAVVDDRHAARVANQAGHADLRGEAAEEVRILRQPGPQELDRHVPSEDGVPGCDSAPDCPSCDQPFAPARAGRSWATSTEQGACRTTASATLPRTKRRMPRRPWLPSTARS